MARQSTIDRGRHSLVTLSPHPEPPPTREDSDEQTSCDFARRCDVVARGITAGAGISSRLFGLLLAFAGTTGATREVQRQRADLRAAVHDRLQRRADRRHASL